jgi:omega-6 fatty acid desaturase (delta-12 desaturase)
VAWRAWYQILNTAIPFIALWAATYLSLQVGYWLTLLLAVPTAMFLVRLFMFQHDCGHGAFTPSQRVNNVIGSVIGVLTLVPYDYWRKTHAMHHASSGNLDIRSFGDIDTLTVKEYLSRSRRKQLAYRLYRHPLVMLVVGPVWQFVIKHRWPTDAPREWKREWQSVYWTNAVLLGVVAIMAHDRIGPFDSAAADHARRRVPGRVPLYVQHQYGTPTGGTAKPGITTTPGSRAPRTS